MKKITPIFSFAILLCVVSLNSFAQTAGFSFTMNPTNGCTPVVVHFVNESVGATSYDWDFGDASGNSTLSDPDHTYTNAGTYQVTLSINSGASTVTHSVTVHGSPEAGFVITEDSICTGSIITVTDTSHANDGSIVFWQWDFGDGFVDTVQGSTATHQYNTQFTYTINLRVINSYGCDDETPSIPIWVINGPIADFTMAPSTSCNLNTSVQFTNITQNAGGATYTWDFGDPASGANNTSNLENPSHTFAATGTYTITLKADAGCESQDVLTFFQTVMTADFTMSTDTACRYEDVLFDNTSFPQATLITWNFDDPSSGINNIVFNVDSPSHAFVAEGLHNVQLIVFANGCSDTIIKQIYILPQPDVSLFTTDDSTYCQPAPTIDFTGTSSGNIVSWYWDFGDPAVTSDTSILQNPSYTFNNFGSYSISLIVEDNFGCRDTLVHPNYIIITAPTVIITDQPDSGCIGETFTFHAIGSTVAGDSIDQYTWNFGDGTGQIIGTATQNHTFNTCGIFDVKVDIHTRDGCTATYTYNDLIRIGDQPNAEFTWQPPAMCYGDTAHFLDASTVGSCDITGWQWSFGSLEQNPDHVFPDTGVYDVQLIVFSNGCSDTINKPQIITIHPPKPLFDITYNCANPFSVLFTDQSHGDEWLLWDFGDNSPKDSTNNQTPTHTYPGIGTYMVTLYDTNVTWGCGYSLTQTVEITDPIAVILSDTTTRCYPATINFDASTSQSVNTVLWDFGDPASGILNLSTLSNPSHIFAAAGDYVVKLVITDIHGCKDSTTKTIHAWGPTAGFSVNNTTGCAPLAVNFTDTSDVFGTGGNLVSWFWDYNYLSTDTQTLFSPTTTHSYPDAGYFNIYLLVTDANGCTDTTLRSSYIRPSKPNPDLNALDTFLCPGVNNLTFNPGVQTSTYSVTWNYGDGSLPETIANSQNTSHDFTTQGTFLVTVTVTDSNNCSTTISDSVYVYEPIAGYTILDSSFTCGQVYLKLEGGTGGYANNWFFILNPPFGIPKTNIGNPGSNIFETTLNETGTWSLTLISTNPGGCSDTLFIGNFITVPGPTGYFWFEPDTGCNPLDVTFHITLTNSVAEYNAMDFKDGTPINPRPLSDTVITHTYNGNTGDFWIPEVLLGYTLNDDDCRVEIPNINDVANGHDTIVRIINPYSYTVSVDTILANEGEIDTLTAVEPYDPTLTYSWIVEPGGETLATLNPPTSAIYVANEGDERIVFTVTDPSGCESFDVVYIELHLCEMEMTIPNVFTPSGDGESGDGKNDTYHIDELCPIEDFKITIFNRWGNIVFESDNYLFRWDGTDDNGRDCAEGVYYYTLHAKRKDLHGYIHLIRGKDK